MFLLKIFSLKFLNYDGYNPIKLMNSMNVISLHKIYELSIK